MSDSCFCLCQSRILNSDSCARVEFCKPKKEAALKIWPLSQRGAAWSFLKPTRCDPLPSLSSDYYVAPLCNLRCEIKIKPSIGAPVAFPGRCCNQAPINSIQIFHQAGPQIHDSRIKFPGYHLGTILLKDIISTRATDRQFQDLIFRTPFPGYNFHQSHG